MARPTPELIDALKATADRLCGNAEYRWTHMGSCNCGHLAQTITGLDKARIHAWAMEREGMWEDRAREYCPVSGFHIDWVIEQMVQIGLTTADIRHAERLSDPAVLAMLPAGSRMLDYRRRSDVVLYFRAWQRLLEHQLAESITLPAEFTHALSSEPSPGQLVLRSPRS